MWICGILVSRWYVGTPVIQRGVGTPVIQRGYTRGTSKAGVAQTVARDMEPSRTHPGTDR